MDRKKVIECFCVLATKVRDEQFGNCIPSDCFCGANPLSSDSFAGFHFEEVILNFIKEAVEARLKANNKIE